MMEHHHQVQVLSLLHPSFAWCLFRWNFEIHLWTMKNVTWEFHQIVRNLNKRQVNFSHLVSEFKKLLTIILWNSAPSAFNSITIRFRRNSCSEFNSNEAKNRIVSTLLAPRSEANLRETLKLKSKINKILAEILGNIF